MFPTQQAQQQAGVSESYVAESFTALAARSVRAGCRRSGGQFDAECFHDGERGA